MALIIILVVVLIAVVVLTVRYIRINADVLSKESFRKAAEKRAEKLDYTDPVITCDYCGAKIDTASQDVCPSCGACFGENEEWINRHKITHSQVEENTSALKDELTKKAKKQSALTGRMLKIALVCLAGLVILILIGVIASLTVRYTHENAKSEELNRYTYDDYRPVAYSVVGDGVLLNESGIKVTVTGIYRDGEHNNFKIEYSVENSAKQDLCAAFYLAGVNGVVDEDYAGVVYEWFAKGKTVTLYDTLYDLEWDEISELVYFDFTIYDDEKYYYESRDFVTLRTTSGTTVSNAIPEGAVLYDDKGIRVINLGIGEYGYMLAVVNDTDNDFLLSSCDLRLDGKPGNSTGIYDGPVLAHSIFYSRSLVFFTEDYDTEIIESDHTVDLYLTFTCPADPSQNLTTPYLILLKP